jgi:general secretion pathway protein F
MAKLDIRTPPQRRLGGLLDKAGPTPDEITLFTQELSWMIAAGVPLGRAFDLLSAEAADGRLGPVLRAIRARLRAGSGLADAMRQQGTVFPETYLRLVALAEVSGTLPLVLNRIHAGRAQAQALRRKVGSALVYPSFLLLVAFAAITLIGLAVVPQMRAILPPEPLAGGGDQAIRRLIGLSDWLRANKLSVLFVGIGGVLLGRILLARPAIRLAISNISVRLPGVGPVLIAARLSEMTRTMAMLTEAGLPFAEALRLTRRTTTAPRLARTLERMEAALRSGQDVTMALRDDTTMPPLLVSLLKVGQETGNMGQSLRQAAEVFEEKTSIALERALTLMEPAIILVISVGVGSLIYLVIGALMSVNDLFL